MIRTFTPEPPLCGARARAPDMWHGKQRVILGQPATRTVGCSREAGHEGGHRDCLAFIGWTEETPR